MFTAADVLSDARRILQDTASDRWANADLFKWLNEAQLKVISIVPQSLMGYFSHALQMGVDQQVSSQYYMLMDVLYNLNGSGERDRAITPTNENMLRLEDPDWITSTTPSATVIHWMQSANDAAALTFRVYPPQPANVAHSVLIAACVYPATIEATDDESEFGDEYRQVFVDYILYRAFSEDHANENNDAAAAKHYQLFNEQLAKYAP